MDTTDAPSAADGSAPGPPDSDPGGPGIVARVRRVLGSVRRGVRARVHRALHPARRRRALAALEGRPPPRHVMILCLGNICRSPYAEARLRERAGDLIDEVESRGLIGPDRPSPEKAQRVASRRGLDLSDHRSRLVTRDVLEACDLVLLVDPAHERRMRKELGPTSAWTVVLGDLDPRPVDSRAIPDPWGEPEEAFAAVFERIDRCLDELLRVWRGAVTSS